MDGSYIRVPDEDLVESHLAYATIYGPGDEKIGSVSDVLGTGPLAVLVIEVGGFLGIGAKRITAAAGELQFMRDENGAVHAVTEWKKDELTDRPHHPPQPAVAVAAALDALT